MPARRAVSDKGTAESPLLTMATMPTTAQYALQTRASKRAKLPSTAIMILLIRRAMTVPV
jgi:hypothetical protein